jgi:hypothetical protein
LPPARDERIERGEKIQAPILTIFTVLVLFFCHQNLHLNPVLLLWVPCKKRNIFSIAEPGKEFLYAVRISISRREGLSPTPQPWPSCWRHSPKSVGVIHLLVMKMVVREVGKQGGNVEIVENNP